MHELLNFFDGALLTDKWNPDAGVVGEGVVGEGVLHHLGSPYVPYLNPRHAPNPPENHRLNVHMRRSQSRSSPLWPPFRRTMPAAKCVPGTMGGGAEQWMKM